MNEGREFVGRKYSQEEEEGMRVAMEEWAKQARMPFEGEQEKTGEEILMIKIANDLIAKELGSLGILDYQIVEPERVHILSADVFKKEFPDSPHAFFRPNNDLVALDRDHAVNKQNLFADIVHELLHRASIRQSYGSEDEKVSNARVGYNMAVPWKKDAPNILRGFNEIMLEYTNHKILSKNQHLLQQELAITPEDLEGSIYSYTRYVPVIARIVTVVSKATGRPETDVYDELERGQFTHKIPVMKEIARAFGGKALRTLSYLMALPKGQNREKLDSDIIRYFATEDRAARDILGEEIHEYFLTHHNIQDENGNSTNTP